MENSNNAPTPEISDGSESASRVPTVLIVEDNKQSMVLFKKFFEKAKQRGDIQCEVIEAFDGDEAIQLIDIANPELILCDISMPKKDGFEVLNHFNNFSKKQNAFSYFCFLTGAPEEMSRAFKAGVMGFIAKQDVNYFVMVLQLKTWLRLAQLERKLENM